MHHNLMLADLTTYIEYFGPPFVNEKIEYKLLKRELRNKVTFYLKVIRQSLKSNLSHFLLCGLKFKTDK